MSDIPHLGYIVAAYVVAAVAVAVMIAATLLDHRDLAAKLADFEKRRDDTPSPPR